VFQNVEAYESLIDKGVFQTKFVVREVDYVYKVYFFKEMIED
jgi:hypothetical protein